MGYGPPTHRLVLTDKENKQRRTRAGVAWVNEKGWISISLKPGININYRDSEELYYISLYPIDQEGGAHAETSNATSDERSGAWGKEDDLPF